MYDISVEDLNKDLTITIPTAPVEEGYWEIAYVIKDKNFGELSVKKSANAWWMDQQKVATFVNCFKNGYDIGEAYGYIGISEGQWRYFKKMHPEFMQVIDACYLVCNMMAETNNFNLLRDGDGHQTRWYLERRKPHKYGKVQGEGGDRPVLNNFGNIYTQPIPVSSLDPSVVAEVMETLNKNEHDTDTREPG